MATDGELQRIVERLFALERQHDLFAFRVDGWSAWRVLRNAAHRAVTKLPMSRVARSDAVRSIEALVGTFKLIWLLVVGGRRELLVRTCRSALRMQDGAHFRDVYFDGLLCNNREYLKIEEINSREFEREAAAAQFPADLDSVVFTFWGRVLGMLFPANAREHCESISRLLAEEFDVKLDTRWLLMRLSTVYWQARLYELLLRRVRPGAVLVADTGEYALCLASHRLGVRFIELQHGLFDADHPDAVPAWVEGSASELLLPDTLASRGDFWIEQLEGTLQGARPVAAVGNELIDAARVHSARLQATGQRHIVLTSQGLDRARLAQWVAEAIRHAPARVDWRISIKLHPLYDVGTHEFDSLRADARVQVIGGAEQPNVFNLLASADLHLSISSACHFDAAALGVPSVIVPLSGHELVIDVVDNVQFFLASEPSDIWRYLAAPRPAQALADRFSNPGFVVNFNRLLA